MHAKSNYIVYFNVSVTELAKNYLKSLFFNFLNVFSLLGLI